ncbi:MAG: hypothetical protein IKZ49_03060 [Alphaproteobacteria bacterium]|nr:hypothetical protein [Alphaproteobacteria bacterium]
MKTKNSIIEKYTIAEPAIIRTDYSKLLLNENLPIMYNNETPYNSSTYKWFEIPTKIISSYMISLGKMPKNAIINHKKRTLHIIKLNNGKKLYIVPNLEDAQSPKFVYDKDIAFNVSPEINQEIVKAIQFYTR